MSTIGNPSLVASQASHMRIAIVASLWHKEITDSLVACAIATTQECGIDDVRIFRVPGVVEIPLIAQELTSHCDGIVALGAVVEGETPHFTFISHTITEALMRISLTTTTPIGQGILTTHTIEQAYNRAGFADSAENKGRETVLAVVHTLGELKKIHSLI